MHVELDERRAAAHLLGRDTHALLGPDRVSELLARWTEDTQHELSQLLKADYDASWPEATERRRELLDALTVGLRED